MLRAVTLDYWDTLYTGASLPERVTRRQEALQHLLEQLGVAVSPADFQTLYHESALEAARWWREDARGYTATDRIHWILARLEVEPPEDGAHVARMVARVDESLIEYPPPLLPGAREALEALGERFALAVVSDTGFASGRAQDVLMERDDVRRHFRATIYSMDVGHAKPRPEIFQAALDALGIAPDEVLHVGDNERTDVAGALAMGMRAVRLDAVRDSGPSRAEHVARSLADLVKYLLTQR